MTRRMLVLLVLLALTAGACGGTRKVGGDLMKVGGGPGGALRNFEDTPTPTARPSAGATQRPATTAKPTASQGPRISFKIHITADGFEPPVATVYVDSYVLFVNDDSAPHSARADGEESIHSGLDSGIIPPGRSWIYHAARAGKISYSDPDRPFALGSLEVRPR